VSSTTTMPLVNHARLHFAVSSASIDVLFMVAVEVSTKGGS
jgi:hypothetical protein